MDEDPHIFIPFLLAVNSNTGCVKFKIDRFHEQHDQRASLDLDEAGSVALQQITRRRGISSSIAFQKLIHALFPTYTTPTTPATSPEALECPFTTADSTEA